MFVGVIRGESTLLVEDRCRNEGAASEAPQRQRLELRELGTAFSCCDRVREESVRV